MDPTLRELLPYVVPLLLLQAAWFYTRGTDDEPRAIAWAAIPLLLVVGFRGNVGTDTDTYRRAFDALDYDLAGESFEPVFVLVARIAVALADDPTLAVNLVSVLVVIVVLSAARRVEGSPAVFVLLLAPAFVFDMSMNGLRYGLAFGLAEHALIDLRRGDYYRGAVLGLLAVGSHSSAALVLGVVSMVILEGFRTKAGLILVAGAGVYSFWEAVTVKMLGYEVLLPPSELSGTAPLVLTFAVLLVLVVGRGALEGVSWAAVGLFAGLGLATFGLARITYAGIRLQFMVLFSLLVYLQFLVARFRGRVAGSLLVALWLVGILAFGFKVRNFYEDYGVGESPFLPYETVLDE